MRAEVLRKTLCVGGPNGKRAHLTIFFNRRWLPLETAYPQEIALERDRGLRLGQVALLESDGCGPAIILRLFQQAWQRIRALGLEVVYVAVAPGDAAFYRRFLFELAGWDRRPWGFADYACVEVMRLDVRTAYLRAGKRVRRRFVGEKA